MSTITPQKTDEPTDEQPSVLVVEDEQEVADLYTRFLVDDYEVTTVYDGEEALATADGSYDVVLLDRRMPERSGDEVLDEFRRRNLGCMVAMVTAVPPDFDIIDMPFEEYVSKPASREDIQRTVERLVLMAELEEVEYDLSSLEVKRSVLEAEMTEKDLADSVEFEGLQGRIEELRDRQSELRARLADDTPEPRSVA